MTPEEKKLYQKINRQLAKEDEFKKLHKTRGWHQIQNLGTYHVVDHYTNTVVDYKIEDLQEYAKQMNIL